MSIILLLSRLLKAVSALVRAISARRLIQAGKEMAHGELAQRQMEKLGKAARARRRTGDSTLHTDRLHEDDGYRRD